MSSQPREVAEEEAKAFLQIIEDSASYQFGYNHSIAYCMIGYLCAYLRYYHTPYFITSYLNNAQNEESIVAGFNMANIYKYNIVPARFRRSRSTYTYDKETNQIYKGVASIKFLNTGAAEYLYSLRENHYDSFLDLLVQIDEDHQVDMRQMEILIKLQYFEEFGKNATNLETYRLFKALYGRKTLPKDSLNDLGLTLEDIEGAYERETAKMYQGVDIMKILKNKCSYFEQKDIPLEEQLECDLEYVGHLNTTYDVPTNLCWVVDVDTKYSPRLQLYSLKKGTTVQCKVAKGTFKKFPIKKGTIIKCNHFVKKNKMTKTEKGWEKTNQIEWWLDLYETKEEK